MKETYIEIEVRDNSLDSIIKAFKDFIEEACEDFDLHIRCATPGFGYVFKRADGTGFIIQVEVIKNVRKSEEDDNTVKS